MLINNSTKRKGEEKSLITEDSVQMNMELVIINNKIKKNSQLVISKVLKDANECQS